MHLNMNLTNTILKAIFMPQKIIYKINMLYFHTKNYMINKPFFLVYVVLINQLQTATLNLVYR